MFSPTAWVLVVAVVSSTKGEKTEQEWKTAIDIWMAELTRVYNARDVAGLSAIMVTDVHRSPPGQSKVIGVHEILSSHEGEYKAELDNVLGFCGNTAVAEFNTSYSTNSNCPVHGKGMAVFTDDDGTLKCPGYIWNLDN